MRPALIRLALSVSFLLSGCASKPDAAGDAGAGGEGGSALVDGGAAGPTAQGADCIVDQSTGLHICTLISICPKVPVDHDVYPNCGWRIRGQALDLECACNGMICPLGSPATCDQATKLLADQTELQACQQVGDGRCVAGTPSGASSSGSSGTSTSTCDKTCAGECANNPACLSLCGC